MLVEPTKFCPAKIQIFIESTNPQLTIFHILSQSVFIDKKLLPNANKTTKSHLLFRG